MTPTPFVLSHLPETPSQTAGPYVHIGLIPNQAGFDIFQNNFSGEIAGPDVAGQRIVIEGKIFDGLTVQRRHGHDEDLCFGFLVNFRAKSGELVAGALA